MVTHKSSEGITLEESASIIVMWFWLELKYASITPFTQIAGRRSAYPSLSWLCGWKEDESDPSLRRRTWEEDASITPLTFSDRKKMHSSLSWLRAALKSDMEMHKKVLKVSMNKIRRKTRLSQITANHFNRSMTNTNRKHSKQIRPSTTLNDKNCYITWQEEDWQNVPQFETNFTPNDQDHFI